MSATLLVLNNKLTKIIAGVIAVTAIAVMSLDLSDYAKRIAQIATYKARPLGIELRFESPNLKLLSFETAKLGITFPRAMIATILEDARVKLSIPSLLELHPTATFVARSYGGSISGAISRDSKSGSPKIQLSGHSIQLGEHRQIAALGLSGELDITDSWVDLSPQNPPSAELHLSVKNGKKPLPTQIDLTPFGAPFTITAPPVQWFNFGLDGQANGDSIDNLEFSLASSLGSINGSGTLYLSKRKLIERVSLEVKIALTELGRKEFGPIISLASNGQIPSSASEFTAVFKGPALRPEVKYRDVQ